MPFVTQTHTHTYKYAHIDAQSYNAQARSWTQLNLTPFGDFGICMEFSGAVCNRSSNNNNNYKQTNQRANKSSKSANIIVARISDSSATATAGRPLQLLCASLYKCICICIYVCVLAARARWRATNPKFNSKDKQMPQITLEVGVARHIHLCPCPCHKNNLQQQLFDFPVCVFVVAGIFADLHSACEGESSLASATAAAMTMEN